jgi:hypothetical protein
MNWRSPRFLFLFLAFFLVLAAGVVVVAVYLHNKASTDVTIKWQASSSSISQQDRQDIQSKWKAVLLSSNSNSLAGHEFTIVDARRQGSWATFSAEERVSSDGQPISPEPMFFLAHQQGNTWTVWIPSSPDFCNELKQVPDTLLNTIDKELFC